MDNIMDNKIVACDKCNKSFNEKSLVRYCGFNVCSQCLMNMILYDKETKELLKITRMKDPPIEDTRDIDAVKRVRVPVGPYCKYGQYECRGFQSTGMGYDCTYFGKPLYFESFSNCVLIKCDECKKALISKGE